MSKIPDAIAREVLVKCGRRCCLCRRFLPIRLQVHHILERYVGGTDEFDNLIALCLTCHTDVHTQAPFTRRFSVAELKGHRDAVCSLVAEGKLVAGDESLDKLNGMVLAVLAALAGQQSFRLPTPSALGPAAARILMDCVQDGPMSGMLQVVRFDGGSTIMSGGRSLLDGHDVRAEAELSHGLRQLRDIGLVETTDHRDCYIVTYEGFLLADQILAAGAQVM